MGIQGRVALITGSGSGIGKRTAELMAENGAKIVINDILAEKVEETVNEFKAKGLEVIGEVCDITNKDAVARMVENIIKAFGKIDILVNNCGGPVLSHHVCQSCGFYDGKKVVDIKVKDE